MLFPAKIRKTGPLSFPPSLPAVPVSFISRFDIPHWELWVPTTSQDQVISVCGTFSIMGPVLVLLQYFFLIISLSLSHMPLCLEWERRKWNTVCEKPDLFLPIVQYIEGIESHETGRIVPRSFRARISAPYHFQLHQVCKGGVREF